MKQITTIFFAVIFLFFMTAFAQEFTSNPNGSGVSNPTETELVEVEVHYDGVNTNGVGAADANFIIAARFTPTQLGPYVGMGFVKLRVFIFNATVGNTGTVKVYSAGTPTAPGPEIYSQNVSTVASSWNEYVLSPIIVVPNADMWFGLQATAGPTGLQFWGGVDAGPHDPNGQFIFFNGSWSTLVALNPALTFNWNIRAVVDTEVPVELTSFTAAAANNSVILNWSTATELNNLGFEVQRKLDSDFATIAFVEGAGTTTETREYSYIDNNVPNGRISYRLKQMDYDGRISYSDVVEIDVNGADDFALAQNYPNPFNPATKIAFNLSADSKVNLSVFDVLGQEVATIINSDLAAGVHQVDFNASGLNSGVYFYKIEAAGIDGTNFSDIKKMILTK
jgi:hypothetical protein